MIPPIHDTSFALDAGPLKTLGRSLRDNYAAASPYPHVVIDDFLPVGLLDAVLDEFPSASADEWQRFRSANEVKLATNEAAQLAPVTRNLLAQCNTAAMCEFLEELTSIEGIVPDPYFAGGGIHQILPGGYLKIHADFNMHPRLRLDRRLNLLVYLNKDWEESFGGHLELWDPTMERCVKRILPIFNRCVIFSTTSTAYHGHPAPLTCPEDRTRKSLALYYYTRGRPEEEQRPVHTTLFQRRPGDGFGIGTKVRKLARKVLPPFLYDAAKFVRGDRRGGDGR